MYLLLLVAATAAAAVAKQRRPRRSQRGRRQCVFVVRTDSEPRLVVMFRVLAVVAAIAATSVIYAGQCDLFFLYTDQKPTNRLGCDFREKKIPNFFFCHPPLTRRVSAAKTSTVANTRLGLGAIDNIMNI